MTYHNLYAINNVVTALVMTDSARLVVDSLFIRGLVVKSIGPVGVNDHAQQARVVPRIVKIQHTEGTTSNPTSIHLQLRSTE